MFASYVGILIKKLALLFITLDDKGVSYEDKVNKLYTIAIGSLTIITDNLNIYFQKGIREKWITSLRTYQYKIFHLTVIEICFEMLNSSEHDK